MESTKQMVQKTEKVETNDWSFQKAQEYDERRALNRLLAWFRFWEILGEKAPERPEIKDI